MTEESKLKILPTSAWLIQSLRLTAFPTLLRPFDDFNWWSVLMGEPPSAKVAQPRTGGYREEGPFCGGMLINQAELGRIDWLFTKPRSDIPSQEPFQTLGPLSEMLDPFVQLMSRWLGLDTCPSLQRIAFGASLLYPVDSKLAGYQQLSVYLPNVVLDVAGSSDFLYQINRQRDWPLEDGGPKINRLSKWSVVATQFVNFHLPLQPQTVEPSTVWGQMSCACCLEIDINTAPESTQPLPQDKLGQLFQQLTSLGIEIVREGDIP